MVDLLEVDSAMLKDYQHAHCYCSVLEPSVPRGKSDLATSGPAAGFIYADAGRHMTDWR